jgi:hypothetical protein
LSKLASFTSLEKDHPFIECATFADEIKSTGFDDQAQWHFVDNPFMDDGYQKDVAPNVYNGSWEIGELISALKGAKALRSGYVSWDLADSFNLRLIIHYIGDIH